MLGVLGDQYTNKLRHMYEGRVSPFADLVCWWFAKALDAANQGNIGRAGLVATNSIRGGRNRLILDAISDKCIIYDAWSDQPWVIDGAAVRVSIVCFARRDSALETESLSLDGKAVSRIHSDLTGQAANATSIDLTKAQILPENSSLAFIGVQKTGQFDLSGQIARDWLSEPLNPNGRPNSDVLRPYLNGSDIVRHSRDFWIVDFSSLSDERQAALYEAPYLYLSKAYERCARQTRRRSLETTGGNFGDRVPRCAKPRPGWFGISLRHV